jgi:hypothetical protein
MVGAVLSVVRFDSDTAPAPAPAPVQTTVF